MTDTLIIYLLTWLAAFVFVLAIAIWIERMTRIIIWNYILWFFCFFIWVAIAIWINNFWWDSWFWKFLYDTKWFILFAIYAWLLYLIYAKWKFTIKISSDIIVEKASYLIYVPLTAIGTFMTIILIFFWPDVFLGKTLTQIAQDFTQNQYIQWFIINIPYIFICHWLASIITFCEFKWKDSA
jgi:hypothetical protein